jgi:hypothetical protein
VTAVLARLLLLGLMLEGLIVAPAMRDSQLHSAVSQVTISQPAAADPTPEPSYPIVLDLSDPRCATKPSTTDCTDYGPIDPLWTPGPTFNYPADCQALWDAGGASLECPTQDVGPPDPMEEPTP